MKALVLGLVLALGSAGALFAQEAPAPLPDETTLTIRDAATAAPAAPNADVGIWEFVKMFLLLALVLGMIVAFVWFLRRLSGQEAATDSPIQVLHTHSLGANRVLQVVDVGGEVLLLGSGDGGVRLIKDLSGTSAADALRLAAATRRPPTPGASFSEMLGGLMGTKPKNRPDPTEPPGKSTDFLKKQRERLKNL